MNYRPGHATTTCYSLVTFQLEFCYLAEICEVETCAHTRGCALTRQHSHSHANRQYSYISEGLIGCVCHSAVWCSGGGVICCHGNAVACLLLPRSPHFITFSAIISIIMWVARGSVLKKGIRSPLNWCQLDRCDSVCADLNAHHCQRKNKGA